MNAKSQLFRTASPTTKNWISTNAGSRGILISFVVTREAARVEIYIDTGSGDLNKSIFDRLHAEAGAIEAQFGEALIWERLDSKRACRIKAEQPGSIYDRDQWPAMIDYMVDALIRLDETFRSRLAEREILGRTLKPAPG